MSLAALCERYYNKKITFLNIDIEGYQGKALEGNNWKVNTCRPQLIFVEDTVAVDQAGFGKPWQILIRNNYRQIRQDAGNNQIYIAGEVYEKYLQI